MTRVKEADAGKKAIDLFRAGHSTLEIARAKGRTETEIYNWLHHARENARRVAVELSTASSG